MSSFGFLVHLGFALWMGWLAHRMLKTGYSPGMSNPSRVEQPGVYWFVFALLAAVVAWNLWEAFERFLPK